MKKLFGVLVILSLLGVGGCATAKSFFCSLDFTSLQTQISNDLNYINSRYESYVSQLIGGNEKMRPWVVAADLALAQLVPVLKGLQQGICYPPSQITQGTNMVKVAESVEP